MLSKTRKKNWLKALLGGKYKQGTGYLRRRNNECCCLGVLLDQEVKAGNGKWALEDEVYDFVTPKGGSSCGTLPYTYELGLTRKALQHLVVMNDSKKASFRKIAAWIKENL